MDSRPEQRVVQSWMWQAAAGSPADDVRRDPPDVVASTPPPAARMRRVPATPRGPGSQIRRYVPTPRPSPAAGPAPGAPEPVKPRD
jgi:hypothetical protein